MAMAVGQLQELQQEAVGGLRAPEALQDDRVSGIGARVLKLVWF